MGAFGLCQFLPSSYLSFAIDGNGDGVVDLFNVEDVIFSVANYLKKHGWSDSFYHKVSALYAYNNDINLIMLWRYSSMVTNSRQIKRKEVRCLIKRGLSS